MTRKLLEEFDVWTVPWDSLRDCHLDYWQEFKSEESQQSQDYIHEVPETDPYSNTTLREIISITSIDFATPRLVRSLHIIHLLDEDKEAMLAEFH